MPKILHVISTYHTKQLGLDNVFFLNFQVVTDYQTHHRLREAIARDRAEYLNERVQYWSIGESVLIIILSIGQVMVLRRFFAEKRSNI